MSKITINSVREELGNPDTELISDEKISQIIAEEKSFYGSVARSARILYNHFSLKASRRMGSLSIEAQERAQTWKEIAKTYEEKLTLESDPYVGGISKADKDSKSSDTDMPDFYFSRGMFEIEDDYYE